MLKLRMSFTIVSFTLLIHSNSSPHQVWLYIAGDHVGLAQSHLGHGRR